MLMRRTVLAALALLPLAALAPTGALAEDTTTTTTAAATELSVTGHGYGHGRGMGQYGAYGYAKDHGWTWQQITDHFYGGTSLGAAPNDELDVLLKAYRNSAECASTAAGCWTIAFVESGDLVVDGVTFAATGGTAHAVAVQWLGGDSWKVYEGDSCGGLAGGAFAEVATLTADQVVIRLADPNPDQRIELIAVCEVGRHRYLRGAVVADAFSHSNDPTIRQRTMNRLPIESYLRSVVPAESPSSWGGTNGTAPGQHALRAQAVAARSYALAGDTRYRPADTCDDIFCQVYRGFGTNTAGAVELFESVNGDLAVADTAGQVRRSGTGAVARTEFSSSTGGWTAGGTFPAVIDEGDDVTANPNHNWAARVPVADVEAAFDARAGRELGEFRGFTVLERNGLGEEGGRVRSVRADFSGGSVTVTGDQFRSMFQKFGVKSDWFVPPPPGSTARFTDTAGDPHEANIEKIAEAGIASGYPDGTFRPNDHVSRGQMATFIAAGYNLPAGETGRFDDTADSPHAANIDRVAGAGITEGCDADSYCPTVSITRGQMAVFLARAEGLEPTTSGDGFCDTAGHPYEGYIRAVAAAGIAAGGSDGCYHPDNPVTRGQMATFLVRALGL